MRLQFVLFIFLFNLSFQGFNCDCKRIQPIDSTRVKSFAWSDLIFLGELTAVDTSSRTYTFTILELFKGDTVRRVIDGKYHDSCSKLPTEKGRWLVYAEVRGEYINISDCLASRSEQKPYCVNCLPPPPPPELITKDKKEGKKKVMIYEKRSRELWREELEWLRSL